MLKRLLEIQVREKFVDREMANRLGIARSTWTDVRNGNRRLSEALQLAAVRAFPELLGGLVLSVSESQPASGPEATEVAPDAEVAV